MKCCEVTGRKTRLHITQNYASALRMVLPLPQSCTSTTTVGTDNTIQLPAKVGSSLCDYTELAHCLTAEEGGRPCKWLRGLVGAQWSLVY